MKNSCYIKQHLWQIPIKTFVKVRAVICAIVSPCSQNILTVSNNIIAVSGYVAIYEKKKNPFLYCNIERYFQSFFARKKY